MARLLTYDTTNYRTQSFVPDCDFILMAVTDDNNNLAMHEAYSIQCLPTNIEDTPDTDNDWLTAYGVQLTGTDANFLAESRKIIVLNGSPGFKYRVVQLRDTADRRGVTKHRDTDFYWDHITDLQSVYN